MRWIVLIVAVVMACIAVLLLSQQRVLWDVTEPGMTVADVRAVLPEAAPPAQPRRLDNGLTLGLVAPNVSNFDRAFDAELYFDDDGLQQVLLRATRLLTERVAMMEFDELRHAATLRYGRELPGISTSLDSVLAEARWRAGPVTIMLRVEKRGVLAAVTMTYEAGV
jgi:hypothetical protein